MTAIKFSEPRISHRFFCVFGSFVRYLVLCLCLLCGAGIADAAAAGWGSLSNLVKGRYNHVAVLLPSGKVLVAGGTNNNVRFADAELYDPVNNSWAAAAPMLSARENPAATLLPDGRVLVVGGHAADNTSSSSAEIYDPATNTWAPAASMFTRRGESHTATLLPNGKVLVVGGASRVFVNGNYLPIRPAEVYDPVSNTWASAGTMLNERAQHTVTLLATGKVLVAGGGNQAFSPAAELYDPATNTWSAAGTMLATRIHPFAAILPDNTVLVGGGTDYYGNSTNSTERYDPVTNTWSSAASTAILSGGPAVTLPNGKVVLASGTVAESYDAVADVWSFMAPMIKIRSSSTATLLSDGRVLAVGGITPFIGTGNGTLTSEVYDPASPGDFNFPEFSRNFGTITNYTSDVRTTGTAVDAFGNVYVVGTFAGASLKIGKVTLPLVGLTDVFVAKLDPSGNTLWAKRLGGAGAYSYSTGMKVDASGNVHLVGHFYNQGMTVPSLPKIGSTDAFAIKLDAAGNIVWAKNFGGPSATVKAYGVAVDSSGNVFVGGETVGGPFTVPALVPITSHDALVIKLDGSGNIVWTRNFGWTELKAIATDAGGNVYFGGTCYGAPNGVCASMVGNGDAYSAKLDGSGNTLWFKNFGGLNVSAYVGGIAVDSNANVFLSGHFNGGNMTKPSLAKIGSYDAYILKLDPSGNVGWAKNFGGPAATAYGVGLALDNSGKAYITGSFYGASMSSPALARIGETDAFAVKLDGSGTLTWAKNFGGKTANTFQQACAVDAQGNLYLGGTFVSADLAVPLLRRLGTYDAYLIKQGTAPFSIAYDGNGSTGGAVPVDSASYPNGAIATVMGNSGNLVKAGYVFAGWNSAANGSGAAVPPGASFRLSTMSPALYAQWVADVSVLPSAPSAASAVAGNTQATVSFTSPAGGGRVTGYTVVSNPPGGIDVDAGSLSRSHVIMGLNNSISYTFAVYATNSNGIGPASATSNSVVPLPDKHFDAPILNSEPAPSPLPATLPGGLDLPLLANKLVNAKLPGIIDFSSRAGTAIAANLAGLVSARLQIPFEYAGQSPSGALLLRNGGNLLAFMPVGVNAGDARGDGVYANGSGQYALVLSGVSILVSPAILSLDQLAALLPGVALEVGVNGNVSANINGTIYSVQPDLFANFGRDIGGIVIGSDGVPRFTDIAGNTQKLNPSFVDLAAVQAAARSLDHDAKVTVELDGSISLVLNGVKLCLVPDLTLAQAPNDKAGQAFWQEGPNRYRLRNVVPANTTQGFTVK